HRQIDVRRQRIRHAPCAHRTRRIQPQRLLERPHRLLVNESVRQPQPLVEELLRLGYRRRDRLAPAAQTVDQRDGLIVLVLVMPMMSVLLRVGGRRSGGGERECEGGSHKHQILRVSVSRPARAGDRRATPADLPPGAPASYLVLMPETAAASLTYGSRAENG